MSNRENVHLGLDIPVASAVDVLVVGGGTAGVGAAVAAARHGADVLLIEHYGFLGGTATAGGVSGWWASLLGMGNILADMKEQLERLHSAEGQLYDFEMYKYVLQEMVLESGAKLWLHSRSAHVVTRDRAVTEIIVHTKSGLLAVRPHIVIDTTGDGDVAVQAGARYEQGREGDHANLPMSLTFFMFDTGAPVEPVLPQGLEEFRVPQDLPSFVDANPRPNSKLYVDMTKIIHHSGVDVEELTDAEILGRRQAMSCVHYLQTHRFPTYALGAIATQIGIRESRRIIGDYVLREQDIMRGASSPDAVTVGTAQIDFHHPDRLGNYGRGEPVPPYHIPYRSLIVKDLDNMLVAGRCASGDQVAESSFRMIPTCIAMGQAAGTAAALACSTGKSLRDIDVRRLQDILTDEGMELDLSRHQPYPPKPVIRSDF